MSPLNVFEPDHGRGLDLRTPEGRAEQERYSRELQAAIDAAAERCRRNPEAAAARRVKLLAELGLTPTEPRVA